MGNKKILGFIISGMGFISSDVFFDLGFTEGKIYFYLMILSISLIFYSAYLIFK